MQQVRHVRISFPKLVSMLSTENCQNQSMKVTAGANARNWLAFLHSKFTNVEGLKALTFVGNWITSGVAEVDP